MEPQSSRKAGRFQKGQSGNPAGRAKAPQAFKDIVAASTVGALNIILEIMRNPTAKESDRVKAAEIIIDRAYGKSAQPIVGDKDFDPVRMEATALTKLIIQRAREVKDDARSGT